MNRFECFDGGCDFRKGRNVRLGVVSECIFAVLKQTVQYMRMRQSVVADNLKRLPRLANLRGSVAADEAAIRAFFRGV